MQAKVTEVANAGIFWKQSICVLCFIQATLKQSLVFPWEQQQLYMQLRETAKTHLLVAKGTKGTTTWPWLL